MPLGVGQGQNVGLRDFCHIMTLLPPEASVFHKHMSSLKKVFNFSSDSINLTSIPYLTIIQHYSNLVKNIIFLNAAIREKTRLYGFGKSQDFFITLKL